MKTNRKNNKPDIIGQKYGRLTVIEYIDSQPRNNKKHNMKRTLRLYRCLCECGVQCEKFGTDLKSGVVVSCGCWRKEILIEVHAGRISPQRNSNGAWHQTAKKVWKAHYMDGLSFQDFLALSQLPCNYCGAPPSNKSNAIKNTANTDWYNQGWWSYNGLDRIDSDQNHSANNVVPACWICNRAKNSMKQEEFFAWISQVYNHNLIKKI